MELSSLDTWDIADLARIVCGVSPDDETTDTDDALLEAFDIGFDEFSKIVSALLPLCMVGTSPITGKQYQGFAKDNCFIVKREIAP